jgi:hypothetical protein
LAGRDRIGRHFPNVYQKRLGDPPSRLDTRQIQQLIDYALQTSRVGENDRSEVSLLFWGGVGIVQRLGESAYYSKRRAQLM